MSKLGIRDQIAKYYIIKSGVHVCMTAIGITLKDCSNTFDIRYISKISANTDSITTCNIILFVCNDDSSSSCWTSDTNVITSIILVW